jgi:hypothetical protein
MRAITRVNPEQASKVQSWTPTRLHIGEGRRAMGQPPTDAPIVVHRGMGNGTHGRFSGQRGKPLVSERLRRSTRSTGSRLAEASERRIVPLKPGNAGGGKAPRFWVRSKKPRMRRLA